MKNMFVLLLIIMAVRITYGQTVVSSCMATDDIKKIYADDADRLALEHIYLNKLSYVDSINIPLAISDTILNALITVYNATTLPGRDVVITRFDIHTFPNRGMNNFFITADSNLSWMKQLQNNNLITGNATIDNLIASNNLAIGDYYISPVSPTHTVEFKSDKNYNLPVLIKNLDTLSGVSFVEPNRPIGDGNDISCTIQPNYVELIYSLGSGDCPAGCTERKFWKFRVYYDCSVEFKGCYGDRNIFPNPFHETIFLDDDNENTEYKIINGLGQTVLQGRLVENTISNLGGLPKGVYIVQVNNNRELRSIMAVKE